MRAILLAAVVGFAMACASPARTRVLPPPVELTTLGAGDVFEIHIMGEVQKPGSIPLQPGMTLLRAISLSGGLTSLAAKGKVTIRRHVNGGTRAVTVSVQDIIDNAVADPLLQAGDSIYVEQRFT